MPKKKKLTSPPRIPKWDYKEYITSAAWEAKKKKYRESKLPQTCLVCNSKKVDLHHRTYKRLGNEWLNYLVPLCREHHQAAHSYVDKNSIGLWGGTRNYIRQASKAYKPLTRRRYLEILTEVFLYISKDEDEIKVPSFVRAKDLAVIQIMETRIRQLTEKQVEEYYKVTKQTVNQDKPKKKRELEELHLLCELDDFFEKVSGSTTLQKAGRRVVYQEIANA